MLYNIYITEDKTPLLKSLQRSYQSVLEDEKQDVEVVTGSLEFEESQENTILTKNEKWNNSNISTISQKKKIGLKKMRTVCLVIALMIHALFEGLTVGLQVNLVGVGILVALLTFHKCLVGFSLGIALVNDKSDVKSFRKKTVSFFHSVYYIYKF